MATKATTGFGADAIAVIAGDDALPALIPADAPDVALSTADTEIGAGAAGTAWPCVRARLVRWKTAGVATPTVAAVTV